MKMSVEQILLLQGVPAGDTTRPTPAVTVPQTSMERAFHGARLLHATQLKLGSAHTQ